MLYEKIAKTKVENKIQRRNEQRGIPRKKSRKSQFKETKKGEVSYINHCKMVPKMVPKWFVMEEAICDGVVSENQSIED